MPSYAERRDVAAKRTPASGTRMCPSFHRHVPAADNLRERPTVLELRTALSQHDEAVLWCNEMKMNSRGGANFLALETRGQSRRGHRKGLMKRNSHCRLALARVKRNARHEIHHVRISNYACIIALCSAPPDDGRK